MAAEATEAMAGTATVPKQAAVMTAMMMGFVWVAIRLLIFLATSRVVLAVTFTRYT